MAKRSAHSMAQALKNNFRKLISFASHKLTSKPQDKAKGEEAAQPAFAPAADEVAETSNHEGGQPFKHALETPPEELEHIECELSL